MDHIHILKYEFINSNSIESELFYIYGMKINSACINSKCVSELIKNNLKIKIDL